MPKKILVADDEPDVLKAVVFRLKKLGYEVLSATDGKETLELVAKESPDIIILDLIMPVIDGYEVCRKLKSSGTFKSIPIILLTASCMEIAKKTKELGADDYILKPFKSQDMIDKIKKYIG